MPPRNLIALIIGITVVPLTTLLWLGGRLLEQDRVLEGQQAQQRVERAADLVVAALQRALSSSQQRLAAGGEQSPDGTVAVSFREGRVEAQPKERVAYLPVIPTLPEAPAATFVEGESLEFRKHDPIAAIDVYRNLVKSTTPAIRAGALLRLGRNVSNTGRIEEALAGLGWIALAEDELPAAKTYLTESLSLRTEAGGKNLEARSWLAMAQWSMEEGRPDLAEPLALKAAGAFRQQKAVHLEAATESLLALSQAMQEKFREARSGVNRASLLAPKVEFPQIRLSSGANMERAEALIGKPAEAAKRMEPLLTEATQLGLVPHQLEIRLALGEAAIKSGEAAKGRALLAALRGDAASKGYRLIARKAAAALERR